jgi:hypothetical protein
MNVNKIFTGAVLSAGLTAACLGVATGVAQAVPASEHVWCPGQPMQAPTGPGNDKLWDMNICHTWYFVKTGYGNVGTTAGEGPSNVFDGEDPPPGSLTDCGYGLFGLPIRC